VNSIVTVTDAASSYDLTTLANVKAELGITDSASDALLRRYITGASKAASNYCNRVFAVETVSERFLPGHCYRWVHHSEKLQLARFPLITVTSVTEDDTVLTVDTDYLVNSSNGQLTRVSSEHISRWLALGITVVYSAGYATVPADLEDAVIRMVTQRHSAKGRDATLRQESIPGVREATYWIATGEEAGNFTPDVADILDSYRAVVVA
jgi:uncharacterized phiE125 gp8 family phage protein